MQIWSQQTLLFSHHNKCNNMELGVTNFYTTNYWINWSNRHFKCKHISFFHTGIKDTPIFKEKCESTWPSHITFFNRISSLFYICKRVSVKHILKFDIFMCTPCAWHTYILHNGSLNKLFRILESKRHEF